MTQKEARHPGLLLHVEPICVECGDDLAAEGHDLCTECLEATDG